MEYSYLLSLPDSHTATSTIYSYQPPDASIYTLCECLSITFESFSVGIPNPNAAVIIPVDGDYRAEGFGWYLHKAIWRVLVVFPSILFSWTLT